MVEPARYLPEAVGDKVPVAGARRLLHLGEKVAEVLERLRRPGVRCGQSA